MIRLHTLGRLEVSVEAGGQSSLDLSPKYIALLAYLAIARPRGAHRRDVLVGLLWPEFDQGSARHALSQALYVLRKELGPDAFVKSGSERVGLAPGAVWTDVEAIEVALGEGRPDDAFALWDGEFLRGFHVRDAEPFEEWARETRESLERTWAGELEAWAESAEREGDYRSAERRWARLSALDPYDSRAVLRRMQALEAAGRPASALEVAEAHAGLLAAELDAEPPPEFVEWTERLRVDPRGGATPVPELPDPEPWSEILGRVAPRRWRTGLAATLGLVALIGGLTYGISRLQSRPPAVTAQDEPVRSDERRVLVLGFRNETGDSTLSAVGSMAADWVTQGIVGSGLASVVGSPRLLFLGGPDARVPDSIRVREIGRETGAGTLVWGSYFRQGDTLYLQAQVSDALTGDVLGAVGPLAASVEDPVEAIARLRQRVLGVFGLRFDPRFAAGAASAPGPPTYEAYREYMAGLERYAEADHIRAVEHYERAAALDTTFVAPVLEAAALYATLPSRGSFRASRADSLLEYVAPRAARLTPAGRFHLQAIRARRDDDVEGTYRAFREAARRAPARYLYDWAEAALDAGHYEDVVVALERLDPDDPIARNYGFTYAAALHMLGRHREELAVARASEVAWSANLQVPALVALGDGEGLERVFSARLRETYGHAKVAGLMVLAARELFWHGDSVQARRMAERALLEEARQEEQTPDMGMSAHYADAAYLAGRYDLADSLATAFAARVGTDRPAGRGLRAAARGDRTRARAVLDSLETLRLRGSAPAATFDEARIAALLGEKELAVRRLREALGEGFPHWSLRSGSAEFRLLKGYPPFEELTGGGL